MNEQSSGEAGVNLQQFQKPGVTVERARLDMDRVTRNLAAVYPEADTGIGAALVPLKEAMAGPSRASC